MKILFIDSEIHIRKELQNIISWSQYGFSKFLEADNGTDALKMIDSENPQLLILDIHLADMSGISLIYEARKNDYNGRIIIISEDTDFENVRLAINYGVTAWVKKPADPKELSDAVTHAAEEIHKSRLLSICYEQSAMLSKNNLLFNILIGNMTYVQEMKSIYNLELNSNYYRLISFMLPQKKESPDIWEEALLLTKNCISVSFSETTLILIASSRCQEQFILRQLKICQDNYPQYAPVIGIVSSQAGSHTELSALYTETKQIYQNLFYYKKKNDNIIYADTLSQRISNEQKKNDNMIVFTESIIRHILFLQSNELEEDTLSLFDFLVMRKPPKDSARFILMNCYSQVISTLTEYYPKLEFEIANKKELTSYLSYSRYLCDSISYLNEQFQIAIAYIRNESRKKPCQRICQYIEANYSSPLKLNIIANLIGYNSAYLGKLFLNEIGVSFNAYLDQIRIQKSAKFLAKGIPVIQTSELTGFNNPDYFTKKFKKIMGILPSEYRAQHLNQCHAQFAPPMSKN